RRGREDQSENQGEKGSENHRGRARLPQRGNRNQRSADFSPLQLLDWSRAAKTRAPRNGPLKRNKFRAPKNRRALRRFWQILIQRAGYHARPSGGALDYDPQKFRF